MTCQEFMDAQPASCLTTDVLAEALEIMKEDGVEFVPVIDDEKWMHYQGMVSEKSVIMELLKGGENLRDLPVSCFPLTNTSSCLPEANISEVLDIFNSQHLQRLPVVDHDGKLVGMIDRDELYKRFGKSGEFLIPQ